VTIEAFSRNERISNYENSTACGLMLGYGQQWDVTIKVKTSSGVRLYKLDRWD
jgi:hypothetical protein